MKTSTIIVLIIAVAAIITVIMLNAYPIVPSTVSGENPQGNGIVPGISSPGIPLTESSHPTNSTYKIIRGGILGAYSDYPLCEIKDSTTPGGIWVVPCNNSKDYIVTHNIVLYNLPAPNYIIEGGGAGTGWNETGMYQDLKASGNNTGITINEISGIKYNRPNEITDCNATVILTEGYLMNVQKGIQIGAMYCANQPYHYVNVVNNPETWDTYWVKQDGGTY